MKKFNLIIPDKDEKMWDFIIDNKKETNINATILRLLREESEKIKGMKR